MKKVAKKERKKKIIKHGFQRGIQVYKNNETNTYFQETKKGYRIEDDKVKLILLLHEEGNSFRSIGRIAKCHHVTARRIVVLEAKRLKEKSLFVQISEKEPIIEMDEMWGFFKKK